MSFKKRQAMPRLKVCAGINPLISALQMLVLGCFWVFSSETAWAQGGGTISGTVTDSWEGTPVPGVAVVLRGSTLGPTTDMSGRFSLPGVPG